MENIVELIQQLRATREFLDQHPELRPVALELLSINTQFPELLNTALPKRHVSAARRKQMSLAAKKRWAQAKKAGKNTIGGGR